MNPNSAIHREVFADRRRKFMAAIGEAVAILPSAPVALRSGDVEFIYRQDNDLYYLTGFDEPEAIVLFAPGQADDFIMFVRPRDKERETWTGRRAGIEGALADYGARKAYTIDEFDRIASRIIDLAERIYFPLGVNPKIEARVLEMVKAGGAMRPRTGRGPNALLDPREIIHEMRLFKRPEEVAAMRQAIAISRSAHEAAMRQARGGMMEWEIEALVNYTFRKQGSAGPSYPSIIASGPNAATLHYINNDREMRTGELMLIDAGCEYGFYASDVTRTFPIGARFSPLQRDLYEIVLAAQLKAIDTIRPGVTFDEPHDAAVRVLVDGMRHLGLLKEPVEEILQKGLFHRFYMHRTSHWLGMDVHDVGLYRLNGQSRTLEPGMVLTAEPGIYIAPDNEAAPEEFRGIGIRIEDDVMVTAEGHEVLTASVPKSVAEIEALTIG
ncbi:MAG TPA: aminopeptidase P N-terminal domain-containing protein [Candidatus Binataceae bacterium]|nr:aminopeptidase P N-terminal domain-containing protein [Candidatus Binataceae bacterium]